MSAITLRRLVSRFPSHPPQTPRLSSLGTSNAFRFLCPQSPLRWITSIPQSPCLHSDRGRGVHASTHPSLSLLPFPELTSFASHFLSDFYTNPPPDSHNTARALLSSLQSVAPQGALQQSLQSRLVDSLSELVRDISQPATRMPVDREATAVKAVAAPQPLEGGLGVGDEKGGMGGGGGGGGGAVRFDEAYSVDQMLVDSLPTLEGEKVVQIGRRDVSRLLSR